jgi:hypothetical protein
MRRTPTDPARDVAALTRVVGGFGAASLLGGGALAAMAGREDVRAFGQQSAAWGAVDVAIAGISALRSRRGAADPARLRRILLVNAVLDVGYVAAGAHLAHHGTTLGGRLSPAAARGHGAAVMVQGLGLLAIDLALARRMGRHGATGPARAAG